MNAEDNNTVNRPGFIDTIVGSFNKPEIYRQYLGVNLKSIASMLALFLFIMVALATARVVFFLSVSANQIAVFYEKNLPEIKIQEGQVHADIPMPYIVDIPHKPGMVVIIDTTGTINNLDDYEKGFLITKNQLSVKDIRFFNNSGVTQTYDLSEVNDLTINPGEIQGMQQNIPPILFPILLIILYLYRVVGTTIQVLIFGLLGRAIYKKRTGNEIEFKNASKLAMIAIIPPVTITTFLFIIGIAERIPGILQLLIFYGIYAYYISYAVNALGADNNIPRGAGDQEEIAQEEKVQDVTPENEVLSEESQEQTPGEEKKSPAEEGEITSSVESPEK
jgi:hypothetical protein